MEVTGRFASNESPLATVPEVARLLSISRSKLYSMMDSGELEYLKLGKSRRIPRQAVVELMERSIVRRT